MSLSSSLVASVLFLVVPGAFAAAEPARTSSVDVAIAGGMLESAAHRSATHDVTGLGGGLELQLGYRVASQLTFGAYTTLEAGTPTLGSLHHHFVGATAGLRAEWHFAPTLTVDSWASIGAGVRWASLDDDGMSGSTSLIGLELAKFQFGGDFPVSPNISLGPVVALSASTFVANDMPATVGYSEIDDKVLDLTITAGVRVRFSR